MSGPLTYGQGDELVVAHEDVALILPATTSLDAASRLHAVLLKGGGLMGVLDSLAAFGFRSLPDFAAIQTEVDQAHIVLRGHGTAHAEGEVLTAEGAATWSEHLVASADVVLHLSDRATSEAALPLVSGVVRGSAVRWSRTDTDDAPLGSTSRPVHREAPEPPAIDHVSDDAGHSVTSPIEAASALRSTPVGNATDSDDAATSRESDDPAASKQPRWLEPPAVERVVDTGADEDADPYDRLFGATSYVNRPPTAPSVQPHDGEVAEPMASTDQSDLTSMTTTWIEVPDGSKNSSAAAKVEPGEPPAHEPQVRSAVLPESVTPDSRASIISMVPSFDGPLGQRTGLVDTPTTPVPVPKGKTPGAGPVGAPALAAPVAGGLDVTVSRASLTAMRTSSAPMVHAVLCPAGHPNPPEAVKCRTCGIEVPAQSATTVPRPSLGELVLVGVVSGAPISVLVDGPLLLGRRPRVKTPSVPMPALVEIPSPDKDLSRTHAALYVEGWHVLLTDLDSVNGTTVTLPGEETQRLRAGDPTLIVPGTAITFADVITYRFEVR